MSQVPGNRLVTFLVTFPVVYFIILIFSILFFKIISRGFNLKFGNNVFDKRRAIYSQKNNLKLKKYCLISFIFILNISLLILNTNKSVIKRFKYYHQWSITINILYLRLSLYNNVRNYSLYLKKSRNKLLHSKYGNRVKTFGIKCLHFNKGNSHFKNKVNDIQILIDKFSPDIITISEANLYKTDLMSINQFSGFKFIYDNFWNTIGWSRQIIMIKKDTEYIHRTDLEITNQAIIWIEIPLINSNNLIIAGGYRQWQFPKIVNVSNSGSASNQKLRWDGFLSKYKIAVDEGKDICTFMDDNINTLPYADYSNRMHIRDMKESLESFANDNNIAILNDEPTRFLSGVDPSCIDHITTNCPEKFYNTNTIKTTISDHCCLVTNYKNKKIKYQPKKIKIRNFKNLTKIKLENAIIHNQNLNTIFNYNEPDTIANIFQLEMNSIIDLIAPLKVVNFKKNYAPYLSDEIKTELKNINNLLTNAIKSKNQDDWRLYRHEKNTLNKKIDEAKTIFLKNKLGHPSKGWKVLNEFKGNSKAHPPSKLLHKNKLISSPKAIADIQNQFYVKKIKEIRKSFSKSDISPIKILEKLRPRVKNKLHIPPITISKTIKIIKKLKMSNSTGWDNITSRILKKVSLLIAPHITHLINAIIASMIYPAIYKISKILPLSKPGKTFY